jgi:hypothetical protein
VLIADRFQLGERLGSGGVAEVHRAIDRRTGLTVALKRLLPQLAEDRAVRQRFLREAEVARRLDHPGIVSIIDAGEDGGRPFLALELVEGDDLRRHLDRRGRLPWPEARTIALAVARALDHAHRRGVVHRDVKPQNILGAASSPRLSDFGLARLGALAAMTGSSLVWGSPEYMAPELFTRGRADPRSDLFSLGVVLFEMVMGAPPWQDRALSRLALGERGPEIPSLGLGDQWDRLMVSLLSPSPSARPASAAELIAALEEAAPADPVPATVACTGCGAPRPEDIPCCLRCGYRELERGHSTGKWMVVLRKIKDDAGTMAKIHGTLGRLTGRQDLRLKFVTGDRRTYSRKELKTSIGINAKLFADVDEQTARSLALSLSSGEVKAIAMHRGSAVLRRVAYVGSTLAGLFTFVAGVSVHSAFLPMLGMMSLSMGMVLARRQADPSGAPLFRLRAPELPAPAADRQLEAARQSSGALAAPEVRDLFVEVSQELFRLGRRAEALAAGSAPGSGEEALARRLLATAPAVSDRLGQLTRRLEEIDAVLATHSEGEAMRTLAVLERRLAGDPPALAEARREVEAALERRQQLGGERESLASSVCRLLAGTRDLYRQARQLSTAQEREAAAAVAALEQLEQELASAGRQPLTSAG